MADGSGRSVGNWLGIALAAMSGMGLFAILITMARSGKELELWVSLLMIGFFACILALGVWLARRPRRSARVVKMRTEDVSRPTPESASVAGPLPAAAPEPAPAAVPEPTPAAELELEPAPAAVPEPEPTPAPGSGPKPAPTVVPEPEPFSSFERQSGNKRVFKVLREQIDLAECSELAQFCVPYDHKVAATIALALRQCGYEMTHLWIGGGSDEVSHTGAVAYGGTYSSLDDFIANALANYNRAVEEARSEYGPWFSSLNWFYIVLTCVREGSKVSVDIGSICNVELAWESDDWSRFEDEVRTVKQYLCGGSSFRPFMPKRPKHVELYRCATPYEVISHDAYVFEDKLNIIEETSEHAPGDRYGLIHEVVGSDFDAFEKELAADGEVLEQAVRREFSGEDGMRKFKDFCSQHGIEIKTHLSR